MNHATNAMAHETKIRRWTTFTPPQSTAYAAHCGLVLHRRAYGRSFALTTSNRNISLDRIAGDVAVTDRNGTIELTAAAPLGAITLQDRNGSVKLVLPEHAGFSVQANTSNGNIDTDFPLSIQGSENRKSVNGTVGAGGPLLRITTTNSDISIDKGTVLPLPPLPPAPPKLTLAPGQTPRAPHVPKGANVPAP